MKTILYNIITEEIKHHKSNGFYTIDGERPVLPNHIKELEVIDTPQPQYNSETHKITGGNYVVNIEDSKYERVWEVVALTPQEIIDRDWGSRFNLRLDVNGAVLFDPMGNAYRSFLQDKGYDVRMNSDNSYTIFLDEIIPSHRPFVDTLIAANLLTETTKPTVE